MTDEERLQVITEQLIIVRDNLFRGLSKSMQKLQAQSINEVLELPNYMQSSKQEQGSTTCDKPVALPPVKFEKVAEGIEVGYDILGGVDIRLGGDFVYVHINYDYRYTHNAGRKALADQIVGLLTTPQQRTWERPWASLTDDEIYQVMQDRTWMHTEGLCRAIEAKLKEKNT